MTQLVLYSKDPHDAANGYAPAYLDKVILTVGRALCAAQRFNGGMERMRQFKMPSDPCGMPELVAWASARYGNYNWLSSFLGSLCMRYLNNFGVEHPVFGYGRLYINYPPPRVPRDEPKGFTTWEPLWKECRWALFEEPTVTIRDRQRNK